MNDFYKNYIEVSKYALSEDETIIKIYFKPYDKSWYCKNNTYGRAIALNLVLGREMLKRRLKFKYEI